MSEEISERKRYRRHRAAFKANVIAQCNTQGVSVARANQLGNCGFQANQVGVSVIVRPVFHK
jgi:hypothetical protein